MSWIESRPAGRTADFRRRDADGCNSENNIVLARWAGWDGRAPSGMGRRSGRRGRRPRHAEARMLPRNGFRRRDADGCGRDDRAPLKSPQRSQNELIFAIFGLANLCFI